AAAGFANQAAEARAIFGAGDFAGNADVIDGRHVHEETAGQRDVTGNAGALFAERLLGDLDDDVLTGFEHFGNELRTARAGVATLVAAIVMTAATRTTIE